MERVHLIPVIPLDGSLEVVASLLSAAAPPECVLETPITIDCGASPQLVEVAHAHGAVVLTGRGASRTAAVHSAAEYISAQLVGNPLTRYIIVFLDPKEMVASSLLAELSDPFFTSHAHIVFYSKTVAKFNFFRQLCLYVRYGEWPKTFSSTLAVDAEVLTEILDTLPDTDINWGYAVRKQSYELGLLFEEV